MILARSHVIRRAIERGYDPGAIRDCFVKHIEGDLWEVDVDHPMYPRKRGDEQAPKPMEIGDGVGTELKNMLAKIGFTTTPGCKCARHAREMNIRGIKWCEENIPTIVSWLEEEAHRRGAPFLRSAGAVLVRIAIRAAKRAKK